MPTQKKTSASGIPSYYLVPSVWTEAPPDLRHPEAYLLSTKSREEIISDESIGCELSMFLGAASYRWTGLASQPIG
jgi:hypothetical protein